MNILSLFDGMACGMLAMLEAGVKVDRYVAYEIDKYAVQTSSHNFPMIEHRGDVFDADFTEFQGFDFLVGGSPCTYWSIAQKNNRETEASGMGWELFSQYVRALREARPAFFIYENNKSMSKAIRESITQTFGFEPICINSALVSAQNRQRLYWVGKRNADGTYSKVEIEQPEDRGILLKDILETGQPRYDKSPCLDANYYKGGNLNRINCQSGQRNMVAEPICVNSKSGRGGVSGLQPSLQDRIYSIDGEHTAVTTAFMPNIAEPVNLTYNGKAQCLRASCYKDGIRNMVGNDVDKRTCVAESVRVGSLPRPNGELSQSQAFRVYDIEGKSVNLTSGGGGAGGKTGLYAVPCRVGDLPNANGKITKSQGRRIYDINGKSPCISCGASGGNTDMNSSATGLYAIPVNTANDGDKARTLMAGYYKYGTATLLTNEGFKGGTTAVGEPVGFAILCEWNEQGIPTKAISCADGKTYTVYEVKDGVITIKGKQYPIKLEDGYYIIRKLTVRECMRLQTVPEWYEFPVSDSQAYKMLGNGWTVEVISHLILSAIKNNS